MWRDPAPDGGPPNGIQSQFGGPAWTLDDATGQYWYHSFLPEQPELDWRNPAVRDALLDAMRFWFARGIDGFRVDVLWMIAKDEWPWRDDPVGSGPGGVGLGATAALDHGDGPDMEARLRELRDVADEFPERVLVGEVYMEPRRLVRYYGTEGRGAHLPFNFALVTLPWDARTIGAAVAAYEAALPANAWPNWVLGNHDQSRVATRLGAAQARVAAMLLLTLRGTPTIYYGDELGLPDAVVPPERIVDVAGRDPERSPMPWASAAPHAGFSAAEPWLPMVDDAGTWSVEAQRADPGIDAPPPPAAAGAPPRVARRCTAAPGRRSRRPTASLMASSRSSGPTAAERVRVLLNLTAAPGRGRGAGRLDRRGGHGRRLATGPRCGTA